MWQIVVILIIVVFFFISSQPTTPDNDSAEIHQGTHTNVGIEVESKPSASQEDFIRKNPGAYVLYQPAPDNDSGGIWPDTYARINAGIDLIPCANTKENLDEVVIHILNGAPKEVYDDLIQQRKLTFFNDGSRVRILDRTHGMFDRKRKIRGVDESGEKRECWVSLDYLVSDE